MIMVRCPYIYFLDSIMNGKKCPSKPMWKKSKAHAWKTISFQTYVENTQISCVETNIIQSPLGKQAYIIVHGKQCHSKLMWELRNPMHGN